MTFLWLNMLWLMVIPPILVLMYLWLLRRKKKIALRYASLTMVKDAMGGGAGWRRHMPAFVFLLAITTMLLAVARPAAIVTLPSQRATVILTMDSSGSMRAEDVEPNRLEAAQTAAKLFIEEQPTDVRIGVVAFAATALVVQPPTQTREDLVSAIDRLQLQRGTAIGSGLLMSLKTLFPDADFDLGRGDYRRGRDRDRERGVPLGETRQQTQENFQPVPPGSNTNTVIILLTDGQTTTGPDPVEAARFAAERGVRVFTVGVGTTEGRIVGFGGRSMRVQLDEETLQQIADITRGQYFRATSANELRKIYETLNSQLVMEKQKTEITALFAAAAAIMALFAALLSILWFNRIL